MRSYEVVVRDFHHPKERISYYYDLLGYIRLNKCSNFLFNKPKLTIDALLGIQDGTLKHWMVKTQNQTQKTSSRFGGVHCRNLRFLLTNGGWKTVRSLGRKWQIPVSDGLKGSQGDLKIKNTKLLRNRMGTMQNEIPLKHSMTCFLLHYLHTAGKTQHLGTNVLGWTLGDRSSCFRLGFQVKILNLSSHQFTDAKTQKPSVSKCHVGCASWSYEKIS